MFSHQYCCLCKSSIYSECIDWTDLRRWCSSQKVGSVWNWWLANERGQQAFNSSRQISGKRIYSLRYIQLLMQASAYNESNQFNISMDITTIVASDIQSWCRYLNSISAVKALYTEPKGNKYRIYTAFWCQNLEVATLLTGTNLVVVSGNLWSRPLTPPLRWKTVRCSIFADAAWLRTPL